VNFSAKLPFTMAQNESDYPVFGNTGANAAYGYFHGYRKFDAENLTPKYYFGFGTSYTTYAYSNLTVPCTDGITSSGLLVAEVDVTNTGTVAGDEIVQLYIGYPNAGGVRRPVKELKAFRRVSQVAPFGPLAPGETRTVQLTVPARDMRYWDMTTNAWALQTGVVHEVLVGASADPAQLMSAPFTIQ
jgi:beta-glucosidase